MGADRSWGAPSSRSRWAFCRALLAEIGAVHGAVALVLFGVAVMAAMRARKPAVVEEPVPATVA